MPRFIIRRITDPTESELDLLERIYHVSGKDDPINKLACGAQPYLLPEYYRALCRAGAAAGHLLVACHEYEHNIVGGVMCFGPGRGFMNDPYQRSLGFDEFVDKLNPEILEWWLDFLPQYVAVTSAIAGPGVKRTSWTLNGLAVDPNFRGRGAGRMLVEAAEALQARQDEGRLMFESTSNKHTELYKYWGYELLGQQVLPGRAGVDKMVLKVFSKDFNGSSES
ncbi:hypothetical protein EIP91_000751 [Steccherinum ochraceum]|uniref:N-acetyltransferase domain-containing protein n=1 Tax=Steccherinum ochraceum TaxID=92696 RepID=A0A4R0RII9_9APHY|nr:hypothetical protein EIP91_000751 [Steccherinum ochraceum]